MVGAGALIEALVGIDYNLGDPDHGRRSMLVYVIFGGMIATTWVQIVKAVLLMAGATVMTIWVLGKVGFNPIELFNRAERGRARPRARRSRSAPGTYLKNAARHRVARARARARHRRPAAHPDALLHRAGRQGGAHVRRLGRRA